MKNNFLLIVAILFAHQLFSQTNMIVEENGNKIILPNINDIAEMRKIVKANKVNDVEYEHVNISLFDVFSDRISNTSEKNPEQMSDFEHIETGKMQISDKESVVENFEKTNQCNYLFRCLDSYGDGWDGAQMQVKQNGIVVSTLGIGFTFGTTKDYTVSLTSGINFEVYWNKAGNFPQECGLTIFNSFGDTVYHKKLIGQASVLTTVFTTIADCTPPQCIKPSQVTVSNLTTESANIQWIENGTASSWQIEWGTHTFSQGTGTIVNTSNNFCFLNGLSVNTFYKFYLRSSCNPLFSDWVGPYYFKTQCYPLNVPFFADFPTAVWDCWTPQNIDGGGDSWYFYNVDGNFSIGHGTSISGYYEHGIVYSPNIILPDVLGLKLEFSSINYFANLYGKNSLLISDDNWATSTLLWSPATVPEQIWQKTKIDISAFKGDTIQFAFMYQGTDAHEWRIDSIALYEGIPEKVLTMKLLLQGLYSATLPGTMNQAKNNGVPQFGADVSDKITIELRDVNNPNFVHYQNSNVFLKTNGTAVISDVPFSLTGSYYIVIKQRNHIETWSATPVLFGSAGQVSYDFTTSTTKAYGNNMKNVGAGYFALFCGDINLDGIIDGLDMSVLDNASSQFVFGYSPQDVNGDGIVDSIDMSIIDNNISSFIQIKRP